MLELLKGSLRLQIVVDAIYGLSQQEVLKVPKILHGRTHEKSLGKAGPWRSYKGVLRVEHEVANLLESNSKHRKCTMRGLCFPPLQKLYTVVYP